jgi:ArsR family transcriptional regulator
VIKTAMKTVSPATGSNPDRPADSDHEIALACKALGHPVRIRILHFLRQADRCICGEIVETLPLAQSTVSQHLKILKEAGLIVGEIEGPRTCYCLDKAKLARLKKLIAGL